VLGELDNDGASLLLEVSPAAMVLAAERTREIVFAGSRGQPRA